MNIYLGVMKLGYRLEKRFQRMMRFEKNIYVWSRVPFYKRMWEDASRELSARFTELEEGIWEIELGGRRTRIHNHIVPLDNPVVLNIAGNKPLCYKMFQREGLPVPDYRTFRSGETGTMKDFIEGHKGFLVIKPAVGTGAGKGVTTHLKTYRECLRAVALASFFGDEIMIEKLVPGECYRILVLDGAVIHASRRRGFRITGDGESSIWHLVQRENARRGKRGGDVGSCSIGYDRDVIATLDAQDLSREFVPAAGREVLVRSTDSPASNHVEIRTEYNENATHLLCAEILDQAVRAASVLDSRFAGVDIITLDPTKALGGKRGVINEINTTPGLHHHYALFNNDQRPVAVDVLRYLLGTRL